MKRHRRLFEPLEPPPPRRKLMHVVDAGECEGTRIIRCECHRCGHDSGWIKAPPLTEAKRGIPCPVCDLLQQMKAVRVLTIRPPWSGLIVDGVKIVENRTWRTKFRGPVVIHAGLEIDPAWATHPQHFETTCTFGKFVGICRLSEVADVRELRTRHTAGERLKPWELEVLDHEFTTGPFGLLLRNVHKFETPIPAKGRLGLWKPEPIELQALLPEVRRWTPDGSLLSQLS